MPVGLGHFRQDILLVEHLLARVETDPLLVADQDVICADLGADLLEQTLLTEGRECVVLLLVAIGGRGHLGRLVETTAEVLVLVVPDQHAGEVGAPADDLRVQEGITGIHMLHGIRRLPLLHERADVGNHTETAPSTLVHGRDRREFIAAHEDAGHHDERVLILEETAGLQCVLTRQLLHQRRVDPFALFGLHHGNESFALEDNHLGIRGPRIGALASQGRYGQGLLVLTERLAHEVDDLGLAVTTGARHDIELLFVVRTLQTGAVERQGVLTEHGVRIDLVEEILELEVFGEGCRGVIGNVRDGLHADDAATHLEGDAVVGATGTEDRVGAAVFTGVAELQYAVAESDEGRIHVHVLEELLIVELLCRLLHHGILEGRVLELGLDLEEILPLGLEALTLILVNGLSDPIADLAIGVDVLIADLVTQTLTESHPGLEGTPGVTVGWELVPVHGRGRGALAGRRAAEFVAVHAHREIRDTHVAATVIQECHLTISLTDNCTIGGGGILFGPQMERAHEKGLATALHGGGLGGKETPLGPEFGIAHAALLMGATRAAGDVAPGAEGVIRVSDILQTES